MRNFLKTIFKTIFYIWLFLVCLAALLRPFKDYLYMVPWGWVLLVFGVSLLVPFAYLAYRIVKVRVQNRNLNAKRWNRIAPLYEAIEASRGINEDDVRPYAEDLATRWTTLELLTSFSLIELFPPELYTIEQTAMGNLANWLEFPTELGAIPEEIEHLKLVTIDFDDEGNKVLYHVYKFRINEPHWAAENGWMLGVVGPYFDDSSPEDHPSATFSRLTKLDDATPEEEAQWVHEHISMR